MDQNKSFLKSVCILVSVPVLWMLWRIVLVFGTTLVEAREMGTVTAGIAMKEGFFGTIPANVYTYGPVQPFLLSLLPHNVDLVFCNRLMLILFLIYSLVLMYFVVKRWLEWRGKKISACVYVTALTFYLYPFFIEAPCCLATPAFTGVFITNLIILISLSELRGKYVLLGALWVIAAFTKPYFILSGIYIFASIFFVDYRNDIIKNILVVFVTSCLLSLPFLFVPQTWVSISHSFVTTDNNSIVKSITNILKYGIYTGPILATVFIAILLNYKVIRNRLMNACFKGNGCSVCLGWAKRTYVPFIYVFFVFFANFCIILRIGGHWGLWGQLYHPQFLSASSTLMFIAVVSLIQKKEQLSLIGLIMACLVIASTEIHFWIKDRPLIAFNDPIMKDIERDYKEGLKVRSSAITGIYEYRMTGRVTDNGLLQYLFQTWHNVAGDSFCEKNKCSAIEYEQEIVNDLNNRRWDVIYTDYCSYLPARLDCGENKNELYDLLQKNYKIVKVYSSPIVDQNIQISRWEKKVDRDSEY